MIDTLFPDLKRLHVLQANRDCSLSATDLLVYSYLWRKRHYAENTTKRQVSVATGLTDHTVSAAIDRLKERRYMKTCVVAMPEHFNLDESKEGFYSQCYFWQYYVPRMGSDCPVSVNMSLVWSYLMHKTFIEKWQPGKGWTAAYLAAILRLDSRTATECLADLHELRFLNNGESIQLARYLTPQQASWFQGHGEKPSSVKSSGKLVETVDYLPPLIQKTAVDHKSADGYTEPTTQEV